MTPRRATQGSSLSGICDVNEENDPRQVIDLNVLLQKKQQVGRVSCHPSPVTFLSQKLNSIFINTLIFEKILPLNPERWSHVRIDS